MKYFFKSIMPLLAMGTILCLMRLEIMLGME